MGGERLYRAQDQPHVPDSVHIGHLDVDNLCAKLAQSVHGGLNGSGLFRLNALSRKAPVKSNPQTTNAFLQFVQHMRHGISQRRGIVGIESGDDLKHYGCVTRPAYHGTDVIE